MIHRLIHLPYFLTVLPYPTMSLKHPLNLRALNRRAGFTLIELLTVIAVIGVLVAISIPIVSSVRESGRAAACVSNLRQISVATLSFANDHRGRFPGVGVVPGGTVSAGWQDVLNYTTFAKTSVGGRGVIQRWGQEPLAGMIYCPSMKPWGEGNRVPRAYTRNSYVHSVTAMGTVNGIADYKPGLPLNQFDDHARKILLVESEDSRDTVRHTAPLGAVEVGNSGSFPPWSGNSGVYAFRHRGRMNVAFMDAHVNIYAPDKFGPLNVAASFLPR